MTNYLVHLAAQVDLLRPRCENLLGQVNVMIMPALHLQAGRENLSFQLKMIRWAILGELLGIWR